MFGSAAEFSRDYAIPIHQNDDRDAARELRKKIYPFILRRLKRDVLKDLPDKIEQVLYVDMSTEQRKLYDAVLESPRAQGATRRLLVRNNGSLTGPPITSPGYNISIIWHFAKVSL